MKTIIDKTSNNKNIIFIIMKKKRKNWLSRLFDMDDQTVSASTVFLFLTSFIALFLLLVPAIAMLIEVYFNHTIASDISGMAEYIAAVCGIFASGGILKGWTNYTNYRFNKKSPEEIAHKLEKEIKEELEDENNSENEEPELDA